MAKRYFVVSLIVAENDYQQEQAAAAREAARRLGADVEILYGDNDAILQGQRLLEIIQGSGRRPDGIVCHPVGTPLAQVARQAVSTGIGWAVLNRDADYIPELRKTSNVPIFSASVDQREVGRIQGKQLAALLPEGGLALYIVGPTSNPGLQMRVEGMESLKPANIQLRTLPGRLTESSGYDAVVKWLSLSTARTSPVKLVVAHNDNMAMGARRAFSERLIGAERERWAALPYLGCDACPDTGQKWVRQGLLTASVFLPPSAGHALEMMAAALEKRTQPAERTLYSPLPFPEMEKLTAAAKGPT